jgi:hypothetical protein
MRPIRIIATVMIAAALAVTGCAQRSDTVNPSAAPEVTTPQAAPESSAPSKASPTTQPRQSGSSVVKRAPALRPVLADGKYDVYIRTVDTSRRRLVVDLVQVFEGEDAVKEAIKDGKSRKETEYLYTYLRNQNPRLRTLSLARDVRINLLHECEGPLRQQLSMLAEDAHNKGVYFTLTVYGGTVRQVQEKLINPAC